jgi:aminoglycoside phosphotransferase (APT) family kinase protein
MKNNYTLNLEDLPVKEAHKLDQKKLSDFLIGKLVNFSSINKIGQFNEGQSNPTYVIESLEGYRYVLRKKPPGKLLPSAHAVDREYKVQKALYETDVPVAKMYLYCEDENIVGTPFYIMEYLEGRVFLDTTLPGHTSEDRTAIYNSMNETLAALHNINHEAIGLENFGRPGSYFVRQLKRWSQQWELSKQQDIPEMPLLIDWLSTNIPISEETTIVHGDYRLGNLIYDLNEPKVIAVLDWELSTLGHPLADLGYNLMLHEEDFNVRDGFSLKNLDLKGLGIPTKEYLVQKYCEMVNREIINPNFYIVFSMFRNVAILEGVLARGRAGNASSSLAEEKGALAKPIAKIAWDLVKNSCLD